LCDAGTELLEQMLAFDPARRVTAAESLQHRYFRDDGYTPITFSPSSLSSSSPVADSARSDTPVPMSCSSNDDSGHSSADGQLPEPDNWLVEFFTTSASSPSFISFFFFFSPGVEFFLYFLIYPRWSEKILFSFSFRREKQTRNQQQPNAKKQCLYPQFL
jgi:serine/threonine protein kinase